MLNDASPVGDSGSRAEPGVRDGVPAAYPPVLFFDGVCGLCSHVVDFVFRYDRRRLLHFAPLQGALATELLTEADTTSLKSVVLVENGRILRHSSAVARMLIIMGGGWRVIGWLMWLIPRPLRNFGYAVVAKYRYWIFGRKESCRLPTPAERARFFD